MLPKEQDTAADIELTSRLIFDAYCQCMYKRLGKPWPRKTYAANRYWVSFVKLGRLCVQEGWDPIHYVENSLNQLSKNHAYITPADLLREPVIARFRTELCQGKLLRNPLNDWEYNINMLLGYIDSMHTTELGVLLSPMTPFPAWFRLLYPEKLTDQMLDWWGPIGFTEYAADRGLRDFARKIAPQTFARLEQHWGKFSDVTSEGLQ